MAGGVRMIQASATVSPSIPISSNGFLDRLKAEALQSIVSAEAVAVTTSVELNTIDDSQRLGRTLGELWDVDDGPREEVILGLAKQENGMMLSVTHAGKTTMAKNLAICLAIGREYLPFTKGGTPKKVAIVDSEDYRANSKQDLKWMTKDFSAAEKELVKKNVLLICDASIGDEELQLNKPSHLEILSAEIAAFGAALTIIDTISKSFVIANENDNSEVKERVMKPLKRLAVLTDSGVLAVHHIGKSKLEEGSTQEGSHRGRGASSFADQSRVIYTLDKDPINDRVVLSCPKIKGPKLDNHVFRLDEGSRWFRLESGVKILTSYEKVLSHFENGETYETHAICKMLQNTISIRSVKENLKSAVELGDLIKVKHGMYQKPNVLLGDSESAESAEDIR